MSESSKGGAGVFPTLAAELHRNWGWLLTLGIVLLILGIIALLLAIYFTVAGIFRIVTAFSVRVPGWRWALFNGIVTLILGILIWAQWPISGLWLIGLFIGIDLIVVGWSQVMTAVAVRAPRTQT